MVGAEMMHIHLKCGVGKEGTHVKRPDAPAVGHDLRVNDVVLGEDSQSVRGDGAISALEGDEGLDAASI